MPQSCTILCPKDDPQLVLAVVRIWIPEGAEFAIEGNDENWSKIEIKTSTAALTLNRKVRQQPGDSFSKMVLGMHNYFYQVRTSANAIKKEILDRVANMALAIGVVAEPDFVEAAAHYDCIFGVAEALGAIVWTGNGAINAEGKMLLDGEGFSEMA